VPPAEALPVRRGPLGLALTAGRDLLAQAGSDTPRLDAELLLAEAIDPAHPVGRERLVIDRRELLPEPAWARFEALLARRQAREPVAYILGRKEFRRLTLSVDRRVLIPRPETELLVEIGSELADGARVLDVGTGSGAVALALKDERPDLAVRGTDVSEDALAVARANAAALDLDVPFVAADLLDDAPADAVLANLPYVPVGAALAPEITRYEPPGALFAGDDGLDIVRRLISVLRDRPVGLVALEIGPEQAAEVVSLLGAAGYGRAQVRRDLAGLDRVVVGTRG
jgi:release factor glutamine methyltransferase